MVDQTEDDFEENTGLVFTLLLHLFPLTNDIRRAQVIDQTEDDFEENTARMNSVLITAKADAKAEIEQLNVQIHVLTR